MGLVVCRNVKRFRGGLAFEAHRLLDFEAHRLNSRRRTGLGLGVWSAVWGFRGQGMGFEGNGSGLRVQELGRRGTAVLIASRLTTGTYN